MVKWIYYIMTIFKSTPQVDQNTLPSLSLEKVYSCGVLNVLNEFLCDYFL